METLSTIEFETNADPKEVMAAVMERGAAAIHGYILTETLQRIRNELRVEPMVLDEDLQDKVPRKQQMVRYSLRGDPRSPALQGPMREAPLGIAIQSRDFVTYAGKGGVIWPANEVIGHRYPAGHFIGPHQDYTDARTLVVSATVDGKQEFFVELDGDDEPTMIEAVPGTVIWMRGFDGDPSRRPRHWVNPPVFERLAFTVREMHGQWDKKDDAQW